MTAISPRTNPRRKRAVCLPPIALELEWADAQDEEVLANAARIMERRMLRLGKINDASSAIDYLKARLGPLEREAFLVLLLDTRHRILTAELLFFGTIDSSEVHPREVVKLALRHNAAAVLCAHNHPSGDPEPSAADRAVTARLKSALALVDIRLLDHIVVTPTAHASLASRGWV